MNERRSTPSIVGTVTDEHRDRCSTIIRSARRRQVRIAATGGDAK